MDDPETPSLDALMARLGEGDRAAFTPVFEALWPRLVRLSEAVLKNEADAADAAQEALEKVLRRASEYDPARAALPWALAIATWECRTALRKRHRRREAPEEAAPEAHAVGAEELLSEREMVDAVLAAMAELSEADREALRATYWEESASVGGATLRQRRARALARLRTTLRRLYGLG